MTVDDALTVTATDDWVPPGRIISGPLKLDGYTSEREAARSARFSVPAPATYARKNALEQRELVTLPLVAPTAGPPPGVRITGGAGGTAAYLEDLHRAAFRIESAAPCLAQISQQLDALHRDAGHWSYRIQWDTQDLIVPWMPPGLQAQAMGIAEQARLTSAPVKDAAWEVGTAARIAAGDIEDLAAAVTQARAGYANANIATEKLWSLVRVSSALHTEVVNATSGPIRMGSVMSILRNVVLLGPARGSSSPAHEVLVDDLAHGIRNLHPFPWMLSSKNSNVESLANTVTRGAQLLDKSLVRQGNATLVPTPSALAPARGIQDAAAGVKNLYRDAHLKKGSLAIQKNTLADGETTWVVMVPGTQGGFSENHGFDWLSNGLLIKGDNAPPTQIVQDAMRQAGIKPGEKVAMVGHSQGGLAAIDISNSGEFDVTHVVTLGTPTARQPSNRGTQYLAVEAEKDIVPSLDGEVNLDRSNRITVRSDGSGLEAPADGQQVDPHSIEHYQDLLQQARRTGHASTSEFFSDLQGQVFDRPIPTSQGQYRNDPEVFTFEGKAVEAE